MISTVIAWIEIIHDMQVVLYQYYMLYNRLIDCLHQRLKSERRKINPCRAKVFTRSDRSIVYFYFLFRIRQLFFIHCNWLYPATQFFNNTVPHQPKFIEVIQILERNSQFESQAVSDLNDLFSEYYMFSDGAHCAPVNLICPFFDAVSRARWYDFSAL